MGLARHMAKEVMREIGNKSREFYEFVLPPVDIKLTIHGNILSIKAEKKVNTNSKDEIICNQRPNIIDKKIRLPIKIKEGEEKVNSAKYADGVLTIKIPTSTTGKPISIE